MADFWLLEAPDSLASQSQKNADGFGLAAITTGEAMMLLRNPVQASEDGDYNRVARRAEASQFLVHLRYANTGAVSLSNTHPFTQDGRTFAHNGIVGDLERLEHRLGDNLAMVSGETDSERFFALVTLSIREAGGDVHAGIVAAVRELAEGYELYSLNFILGALGDFWAFRYPEHNPLHLLERDPGGANGDGALEQISSDGTVRLRSEACSEQRTVVIASEKMDDDPRWGEVAPGELIHVGADLAVDREIVLTDPPRHQMVLSGRSGKSQSYERDD